MNDTVADIVSNAAKREKVNEGIIASNKIYGEKFDEKYVSPKIFVPGKVYVYLVNIYDKPVSLQDFKELKPDIRATRGMYTIQYIPAGSMKRNPKFPYLIGQDLVRLRVTVSGPAHWAMLCTRIPELAWVNRNSTICGEMFKIAKMHPGLVLRFGIDFPRYCKMIINRANELGIDIDNKPLVTYQWGSDSVPVVEDGELFPIKTKQDYAEDLRTVQENIVKEEDV